MRIYTEGALYRNLKNFAKKKFFESRGIVVKVCWYRIVSKMRRVSLIWDSVKNMACGPYMG
jgi:hypothetical protein